MLSLFELFQHYGLDTGKLGLVRHSNKEIDALNTFKQAPDKFLVYTSWQPENKYSGVDHLAVFSSYQGTSALFLGIYSVNSCTLNHELEPKYLEQLKKYKLPIEWYDRSVFYHLNQTEIAKDLSERLVIEWGKATVAWYQKKDKEILQIKTSYSLSDFKSYYDVRMSYDDLKSLISHPNANPTWYSALSSVNGVYLIKYSPTGQLYIGSAYGSEGIWGRWSSYAQNGHGGNTLLKGLLPTFRS